MPFRKQYPRPTMPMGATHTAADAASLAKAVADRHRHVVKA
jgi:hypothetical protein